MPMPAVALTAGVAAVFAPLFTTGIAPGFA
jgi:hypothetical protein